MTFSPLVNQTMVTSKRSSRRGRKISGMVIHHWAGTNTQGGINTLVHNKNQKSANYLILSDGTLIGSVPEEYRAWTTGSWETDSTRVTVEVQNSTGAPNWEVSDAAYATLTRLVADVAARNNFPINRITIRGHREFAATACPGPYLYPRLENVVALASQGGAALVSNPAPTPAPVARNPFRRPLLVVDGNLGEFTITEAQLQIGTYPDGKINMGYSPFVAAVQRMLNRTRHRDWQGRALKIDGVGIRSNSRVRVPLVGKYRTLWALQSYLGTPRDGYLSRKDSSAVREIQRKLNAGTFGK